MRFKLACGDVLPGCSARFDDETHDGLLVQVAEHAAAEHGISEITPEVRSAVESRIVVG